MKRKLLSIVLVIAALFMTGCGDMKQPISPSTYKTTMEEKQYTVIDHTMEEQVYNSAIQLCYVATKNDQSYQIKYYSLENENAAQSFYLQKVREFAGMGTNTELNVANYSKYTQLYNNKYGVISRISNTVIYVDADNLYTEELKLILKELGY